MELSGEKLSTINPETNATDEFGNPIEFDNQEQGSIMFAQVIGSDGETPETRIDELEEGVLYVLDYNVTDFREITSTVKRYLQVVVTPPTIENIEFVLEFEYGSAKDNSWTVEYLDPGRIYGLVGWSGGKIFFRSRKRFGRYSRIGFCENNLL